MDTLTVTAEEFGMKINVKKTKVMSIISKTETTKLLIKINGCALEQVKEFRY